MDGDPDPFFTGHGISFFSRNPIILSDEIR